MAWIVFDSTRLRVFADITKTNELTSGSASSANWALDGTSSVPNRVYLGGVLATQPNAPVELKLCARLGGVDIAVTNRVTVSGGVGHPQYFNAVVDYIKEYRGPDATDFKVFSSYVTNGSSISHRLVAVMRDEVKMFSFDAEAAQADSVGAVALDQSDSVIVANGTFFDYLLELARPHTTYGICLNGGSATTNSNTILAQYANGGWDHVNGNYKGWFGQNNADAWSFHVPNSSQPYAETPTNAGLRAATGGVYILLPDTTGWRTNVSNGFTFNTEPSQLIGWSSNGVLFIMTAYDRKQAPAISLASLSSALGTSGAETLFAMDGGSSVGLAHVDQLGNGLRAVVAGGRHSAYLRRLDYLRHGGRRNNVIPIYLLIKWKE